MRNAFRIFVRNTVGRIPLRRPRRKWEDIIRNRVGRCGLDSSDSG